ncbi:MAG: hypothetical protein HYS57_00515 [Parcubacteria group bacterium]|nr:hypothetical protein [Parcubacteria group bacterium]
MDDIGRFREGSPEWFAAFLYNDPGRNRFARYLTGDETWSTAFRRMQAQIAQFREKGVDVQTLAEFLSNVWNGRTPSVLSPSRYLLDRINELGFDPVSWRTDERRARALGLPENKVLLVPKAFADLVGQEWQSVELCRFLSAMADGRESARKIIALIGPKGSGKSRRLARLKQLFESGPGNYGIWDCPFRHNPLYLVPRHLRPRLREIFGHKGLRLWLNDEDDICPLCHFRLTNPDRLVDETLPPDSLWTRSGVPLGMQEAWPVWHYHFSQRAGRGIATVPVTNANNQDATLYTGDRDLGMMPLFPSMDDPRAAVHRKIAEASGGLLDQPEFFKNESEVLNLFLTLVADNFAPGPGGKGTITTHLVVVAHSNEAEWYNFQSDPTNEAFLSRVHHILSGHNLRFTEELDEYRRRDKLVGRETQQHLDQNLLEAHVRFVVLTRVNAESTVATPAQRVECYDRGVAVNKAGKPFGIADLIVDPLSKRDGMIGLGVRDGLAAFDLALKEVELLHDLDDPEDWPERERWCPTFDEFEVRGIGELLQRFFYQYAIPESEQKRWLGELRDVAFNRQKEKIVGQIGGLIEELFAERLDAIFQRVRLQAAELSIAASERKVGEPLKVDVPLLKQLYSVSLAKPDWDIRSAGEKFWADFHHDVVKAEESGEKVAWDSAPDVRMAIMRHFIHESSGLRDALLFPPTRLQESSQARDDYLLIVNAMIARYGYCRKCADRALKLVARRVWQVGA